MNHQMMVRAFNEWMRRYIEEPERFEQEWKSVSEFLADEAKGEVPSYGEECAALLLRIATELAS